MTYALLMCDATATSRQHHTRCCYVNVKPQQKGRLNVIIRKSSIKQKSPKIKLVFQSFYCQKVCKNRKLSRKILSNEFIPLSWIARLQVNYTPDTDLDAQYRVIFTAPCDQDLSDSNNFVWGVINNWNIVAFDVKHTISLSLSLSYNVTFVHPVLEVNITLYTHMSFIYTTVNFDREIPTIFTWHLL